MKEKIQELYEEVSRYKGTDFITIHKLSKIEKLIEELKEESREFFKKRGYDCE